MWIPLIKIGPVPRVPGPPTTIDKVFEDLTPTVRDLLLQNNRLLVPNGRDERGDTNDEVRLLGLTNAAARA